MGHRIEVRSKVKDTRGETLKNNLASFGFKTDKTEILDVYTINKDFNTNQLEEISKMLINPVTEEATIDVSAEIGDFDWALEVGFLPGVTDNVASTVKEEIIDLFGIDFTDEEGVYSSRLIFIKGKFLAHDLKELALTQHNPLIQRALIKDRNEYQKNKGMGIIIPKVVLADEEMVSLVDLDVSDEELTLIGKAGIKNPDGTRRGPLALDLPSMKQVQRYFKDLGRKPTDIEVESIAQTWSEHCKHTIFASKLDEDVKEGLYKGYIKKATQKIRKEKGDKDICVSVFVDNSGAIEFDKDYLITDKVETHNSPSALDPFGGAITGIVGVNRDAMGFGQGSKPVINRYGFCFADPRDERPLYKGENKQQKMLSPRKIMEGVIDGVNVGGNCSGIPTPQGFVYFDENYRGKPLVFVGTIGLIPKKVNGEPSWEKEARNGDYIVMAGGRVGADGIHGATFSSEVMDSGSPATAVQIGDPITQKKMSDCIVKEARDLNLYTSITDNGAGGISCSVAEMAKESGGCFVELDKVPLKYAGLKPWETWISESQERMTLSVPKDKWPKFNELMQKRGVEATVIGEFNNSGRCIVKYASETIMDIDMEFLHDGVPEKELRSTYTKTKHDEPETSCPEDLTQTLEEMLKRLNITSHEFISVQFDHEVQGGSVIKPLQGKGRVNGDASVTRPKLDSKKGVVLSQALHPSYSDIDTYHMAACSIDTAIRNAIAVGGNLDSLALLDNFCWCSSNEPERLGQLKEAVRACYDYAVEFGTPFISGKDSMFNDFSGYDENNKKIKISVPPTLLISSIGVVEDSGKTIDLAVKQPGDLVYVIGETKEELGGSEYFAYLGEKEKGKKYIGNAVPKVDAKKARGIYTRVQDAINNNLVVSAVSLDRGGMAVGLAKSAIAGGLGLDINLSEFGNRADFVLFSESQSRFVVTVAPAKAKEFEEMLGRENIYQIGKVREDDKFMVKTAEKTIINTKIGRLENNYKETLRDY